MKPASAATAVASTAPMRFAASPPRKSAAPNTNAPVSERTAVSMVLLSVSGMAREA